jgi:hypothetical protein
MMLLSLLACLLIPISAFAGGNVLNGPKNCQSLKGDNFEAGDPRASRFEELCNKSQQGGTLTDNEYRELQQQDVQLGHGRYDD